MESKEIIKSKENGKKVWESMLHQLAETMGFFSAFLSSIMGIIKKHFLWALVFGILGVIPFGGYYYTKPKIYEAQMTVSYNDFEKKIYADMIVKIDALAQSGHYEKLSEILQLPAEELKNIISISSYNIRHQPLTEDLSTEHIPFYIEVKVKDIGLLEQLESAIINYLNSSNYLLKRKAFILDQNKAELDFLYQRMAILDSLSQLIIIKDEVISMLDAQKEVDFNKEIIDLYSKIKIVNSAIHFNNNVEVMDGFVVNNKPIGKPLKYFIILGFLVGIVIRIFILIFKS